MGDDLLTNLLFKGRACREQGLLNESRDYFEQCLEASWLEGDFTALASAVNEIGNLSIQEGKYDQAKECFDKALQLARKTSNTGIVGTVLKSLGHLNSLLGRFERRWKKDVDTRVASLEQDREWKRAARLYHELGTTFRREEKLEDAIRFYSRSIRMARRADERELLFESCVATSEVLIRMERPHQARNFIRRALAAASRLGDPVNVARALVVFGSIERDRGSLKRTEKALKRALSLLKVSAPSVTHSDLHRELGLLAAARGHWKRALFCMCRAHRIMSGIRSNGNDWVIREKLVEIETDLFTIARSAGQLAEVRCRQASGHSDRVARLGFDLAREIGLTLEESKGVFTAGFLHDLGMLEVDRQESGLSCGEQAGDGRTDTTKAHPIRGYNLLDGIDFPWNVRRAVLSHHERCDGTGYPEGLHDRAIPVGAKILAIVDVYDILTTPGTGRRACTGGEALDIMEEDMAAKFDESVFRRFRKLIQRRRLLGDAPDIEPETCGGVLHDDAAE